MNYKQHLEEENPLWRNYIDKVNVQIKWLKEIELDLPFPAKNYAYYTEEEFEELLKTNDEFNKKWGAIT